MDREDFVRLLNILDSKGIQFYNSKTEMIIKPITVAYKLDDEDFATNDAERYTILYKMPPREYFASEHWLKLQAEKLQEQPTCEGCGNKAYKVFKKTWDDKGRETMDSLYSICTKCKVVDGELISFKDVKESINKDDLKDAVDNMVHTIIVDKAKQELNKR